MKTHKDLAPDTACLLFHFHEDHYDVSLLWNLSEGFPEHAVEEVENILHGLAGILANHYDDVIETGQAVRTGIGIARKANFQTQTDAQDAGDLPDPSAFNIDPKVRH